MRRIEIGQILKTNYGTGPYQVVSIVRGCICKSATDFFDEGPDMPPHLHLYLRGTVDAAPHNRGEEAWLGWYDEVTLKSVIPGDTDRILLCENAQFIQATLTL